MSGGASKSSDGVASEHLTIGGHSIKAHESIGSKLESRSLPEVAEHNSRNRKFI